MNMQKIPLIPFISSFYQPNDIFAYILYLILTYSTFVEFVGHTLMAFNRFTLISFPTKHQRLWSRQWYIVIMFLISLLLIAWRIPEPVKFSFDTDSTVSASLINKKASSIHLTVTSVTFFVTTFFTAIFNVSTFTKFYCYKNSVSTINVNEKKLLCKVLSFEFFCLSNLNYKCQMKIFRRRFSKICRKFNFHVFFLNFRRFGNLNSEGPKKLQIKSR